MHSVVSVILGAWIVAMAILSVQNAAAVSVRFLFWQSISLPLGIVLGFAVGAGILLVAIAKPLWQLSANAPRLRSPKARQRRPLR